MSAVQSRKRVLQWSVVSMFTMLKARRQRVLWRVSTDFCPDVIADDARIWSYESAKRPRRCKASSWAKGLLKNNFRITGPPQEEETAATRGRSV